MQNGEDAATLHAAQSLGLASQPISQLTNQISQQSSDNLTHEGPSIMIT